MTALCCLREVFALTEPDCLDADSIVRDVMRCWPQTVAVFLDHRMACVGCAMGRFCTLAEAAQTYRLDCAPFLDELQQAALQPLSTQGDLS